MSRTITTIIVLTLLHSACSVNVGIPSSDGFDAERLLRIDDVINRDIDDDKISGAVGLVARDGKIVYHKAFGYADIADRDEMTTGSLFRIASMTKAITSVGVMMLYERGHFQLNDPISRYIPAFVEPQVAVAFDDDDLVTETRPAKREIRIVDLLTHSAGISYGAFGSPLSPTYRDSEIVDGLTTADMTVAETMDVLAKQPLLFDPGEGFEYGLNTDVLGYLVEVVSGKSLDDFFRDEIFEPLGMMDTYFYVPDDKASRLVTLYSDDETFAPSDGTRGSITVNPNYPIAGARTYFSGGAGLSSTAEDYFRFVQMLLNDGELDGNRLLGRKSVELMRSPRIDMDNDGDADFGLGFQVTGDLGQAGEISSPSAYAWGGAFNTSYWIDPEEQLVAVFMSNVFPYKTDIRARFRTAVYQALD